MDINYGRVVGHPATSTQVKWWVLGVCSPGNLLTSTWHYISTPGLSASITPKCFEQDVLPEPPTSACDCLMHLGSALPIFPINNSIHLLASCPASKEAMLLEPNNGKLSLVREGSHREPKFQLGRFMGLLLSYSIRQKSMNLWKLKQSDFLHVYFKILCRDFSSHGKTSNNMIMFMLYFS